MTEPFETHSARATKLASRGSDQLAVDEALLALATDEGSDDSRNALERLAGVSLARLSEFQLARVYLRRVLARNPDDALALAHMGRIAYQQGRWREAEAQLLRAVELDPQITDAWEALVMAQSAAGDHAKADETIAAYERVADVMKEIYTHEGNIRWSQGNRALAEDYWRKGAKAGDAKAAFNLFQYGLEVRAGVEFAGVGVILRNNQQLSPSIEKLRKGIEVGFEQDTRNVRIHRFLIGVLQQAGRPDEAVEVGEAIVETYPERADAWLAKSLADGSLESVARAYEFDKDIAGIAWARALSNAGRAEEALAVLDARLSAEPDDAEAHCVRGEMLIALGNIEAARAALQSAEDLGFLQAASIRVAHCDGSTAMDAFRRGQDLNRQNQLAQSARAFDEAAEGFRKLVRVSGDHATRHLARALVSAALAREGTVDNAALEPSLREAISLDETYAVAVRTLGRHLLAGERAEEGLAMLARAAEVDPADGRAWLYRAQHFYAEKRYEEAIESATGAAEAFLTTRHTRDAGDALIIRGLSYQTLGRLREAEADFDRAEHPHAVSRGDAVREKMAAEDPSCRAAVELFPLALEYISNGKYPLRGSGLMERLASGSERATELLASLKNAPLDDADTEWLISYLGEAG